MTVAAPAVRIPSLATRLLGAARRYVDVAVVVAVLVTTNIVAHFTTPWASIAAVPIAAFALLAVMRHRGLAWADLGLSRASWRPGAKYAAGCVGFVALVVGIGVALPFTRDLFLNNRYATVSGALLASMVLIPLQTVIPEELAFRGILHGALHRAAGFRVAIAAGSLLFGFWHIATSIGLTSGNRGLAAIFGTGVFGQIAGVVGAVLLTAAAGGVFTWLRARSGSLLAPIALHWAFNGCGALAAAYVWQTTLG